MKNMVWTEHKQTHWSLHETWTFPASEAFYWDIGTVFIDFKFKRCYLWKPTVLFNPTSSQNLLNTSGIAGTLLYDAKFENAPLMPTLPLVPKRPPTEHLNSWNFHVTNTLFVCLFPWEKTCKMISLAYTVIFLFSNADSSFTEKGFTHILLPRFVLPKYEPWLDQTLLKLTKKVQIGIMNGHIFQVHFLMWCHITRDI